MIYYLYKITNNITGMIYVGVHRTQNINDNYMGSGKILRQAIKKYGKTNFTKDILEYFNSSLEMFKREKEIVNEDFVKRSDVYNIKAGGDGGWSTESRLLAWSPEVNARRSKTVSNLVKGNNNPAFGTMWITNEIENSKILKTDPIPLGWRKGRIMPAGWGDNVRNKLKGRKHLK